VRSRAREERGQVTVLVLGMALLCFAVAGVAVDGTRAFLFRRTLQNAADSAALAGAAELDRRVYYGSGGRRITLDPGLAGRLATAYFGDRALDAEVAVDTGSAGVAVVARGEVATTWLGLVGIETLPVAVEARAAPLAGGP
jgi:Flp pilus assembly protein TadG